MGAPVLASSSSPPRIAYPRADAGTFCPSFHVEPRAPGFAGDLGLRARQLDLLCERGQLHGVRTHRGFDFAKLELFAFEAGVRRSEQIRRGRGLSHQLTEGDGPLFSAEFCGDERFLELRGARLKR